MWTTAGHMMSKQISLFVYLFLKKANRFLHLTRLVLTDSRTGFKVSHRSLQLKKIKTNFEMIYPEFSNMDRITLRKQKLY